LRVESGCSVCFAWLSPWVLVEKAWLENSDIITTFKGVKYGINNKLIRDIYRFINRDIIVA
jgi:hypothetical protein